ncbi:MULTISPECIES: type II restriction endonuclease [Lysobacter]|uniref:type II restriction endonuclease n=1 Tax=Lysobacteraceae TaxID=32033 RepID=UPI000691764A|nr:MULTISPECIES: type II restriction endonuclease [Lysobacter]
MTEQSELYFSESNVAEVAADGSPLWWKIQSLASQSTELFVKKLSRNDTSWADDSGKHQAGFYIPRPIREAGFFPELQANNPAKLHIFHAECTVLWPQTGEITLSNMRHYSNKGPETHFTGLPKPLFRDLTPASLILSGRLAQPISDCSYWIIVLDSATEEAELLETALDLEAGFHYGRFEPSRFEDASRLARDETQELIERLQSAIRNGTLPELLAEYADIPNPATIAAGARKEWLQTNGFTGLDPWAIPNPGDAIMEISRDIEFRHYRRYELRRRAVELVSLLADSSDLTTAVVRRFPEIDRVFLSASQQRKNRAGRSFEHHIAASLKAGHIRFTEQAVTGGRRPDFVMPDLSALRSKKRTYAEALVLAAKTTLRERWKQVSSERLNCDVFLATVDDRVAASSIREMANADIRLVVPEALKSSDEAHYKGQPNVLSFREFFDGEIRKSRPFLVIAR